MSRQLYARLGRSRSSDARRRMVVIALAAVCVTALAVGPTARADDRGVATTVITAQLLLLEQQGALNKCLVASPRRNTPCITRASRRLATVAVRQITAIRAAIDGDEIACVRTVATQEISILGLWRRGALALARNERKRAKALFALAANLGQVQARIQPRCFADVLTAP